MLIITLALLAGLTARPASAVDENLWLEDLSCARALSWADARTSEAVAALGSHPEFAANVARVRAVRTAPDRLPRPQQVGAYVYDFWQDATHARGIWRRTTPVSFRAAEPAWETLLDLDELASAEGEDWVWDRAQCLESRCLITLSRGGADAVVVREFDVLERRFVADGFTLPEANSVVMWDDVDVIFVATDEGPGSMTTSGYPRRLRRWTRGRPLVESAVLLEVSEDQLAVFAVRVGPETFVQHYRTNYRDDSYLLRGGRLIPIAKPPFAQVVAHASGRLIVALGAPFAEGSVTYPAGALIALGRNRREPAQPVFVPDRNQSFQSVLPIGGGLLITYLDDVVGRLRRVDRVGGAWRGRELDVPVEGGAVHVLSAERNGRVLVRFEDYLRPPTIVSLSTRARPARRFVVKRQPPTFDASRFRVHRRTAVSRDGTHVPYEWIGPIDADGPRPTVLHGYGAFGASELPDYLALEGRLLLERGISFAVSHGRGGGEFGPAWHGTARGRNRQRSYDDFIAVAEDLIAAGLTTPATLGITGASNGGLLISIAAMQRPDLYRAGVGQVPLLDMKRFHRLLGGSGWLGEYGNPDDRGDWRKMKRWSPYHLVDPEAAYPDLLYTSSLRDDRVHPGHARKMVARLRRHDKPVWYVEEPDGGHAGSGSPERGVHLDALKYTFLQSRLLLE